MKASVLRCLIILILFLCASCGLSHKPVTPPDTHLPVPANAQQEQTRPLTGDIYGYAAFRERTEFVTNDTPAAILEYYKPELAKAGWKIDADQYTPPPHILYFGWQQGCPLWRLVLTAQANSRGETVVYLDLMY